MAELVYGMSRKAGEMKETILVSLHKDCPPSDCWSLLVALGENTLSWQEPWRISENLDEVENATAFLRGTVIRDHEGEIREIEAQKFGVREGKVYKPLPNKVALSA